MAEVTIEIAGRYYPLACRDGEETHLLRLGRIVDARAQDAVKAMGNLAETRQLLVAALLLADELSERKAAAQTPPSPPSAIDEGAINAIEYLAERMENLAGQLEKLGITA